MPKGVNNWSPEPSMEPSYLERAKMERWAHLPPAQQQTRWKQANNANAQKGKQRREEFLGCVLSHPRMTIKDICAEFGISYKLYAHWRMAHPDFRFRMDELRISRRLPADVAYTGTFMQFRKRYFGFDTYLHQAKIIEAIETCPPQGVVLVLVPPDMGKTTVLEDWICFKLASEPNARISVVSEGQPHARKIINRVKRRMTEPSPFTERWGPFYAKGQEREGKPWTAEQITVVAARHDERDASLKAFGWRSGIAGTRTDYLIFDDISSLKNYNQTDQLVHTVRQDFLSRPGVNTRILFVGTRVGPGDIYEKLMDASNEVTGDKIVSRSVILPALDENDNSLAPEMWPTEALQRKRTLVGEDAWWRNYQQSPRNYSAMTFTTEMVEACRNEYVKVGAMPESCFKVMGLDPALGGWTALTLLAVTAEKIRIVDQWAERNLARVEQIINAIQSYAQRYSPDVLIVEANAYQKGLANDERLRDLAKEFGFRIYPHYTGGGGIGKQDEIIGIARMATSFIDSSFDIPWADDQARRTMSPLIDQLYNWTPSIPTRQLLQDRVMSLWFAWIQAKERQNILKRAGTSHWVRSGLPYAPTRVPVGVGGVR